MFCIAISNVSESWKKGKLHRKTYKAVDGTKCLFNIWVGGEKENFQFEI